MVSTSSNAPKAKAKAKAKPKAKAKAPKPKPSAHRHREEVGGSEWAKWQRKGVARWSEDPLSSLNLGGSQGKLEVAHSGKGGAQGPVSSESACDSQFDLSHELLHDQRNTREQPLRKREHAELLKGSSSDSESDDIFGAKLASTPSNTKAPRGSGATAAVGQKKKKATARECDTCQIIPSSEVLLEPVMNLLERHVHAALCQVATR